MMHYKHVTFHRPIWTEALLDPKTWERFSGRFIGGPAAGIILSAA